MFARMCILVVILFTTNAEALTTSELLADAYNSYKVGENAGTIAERKTAFNKSLEIYSGLNEKYHPEFSNGKLYFNLGNNFYQVEDYPWAVFYYYKAQTLRPQDEKLAANLNATLGKLGIEPLPPKSVFEKSVNFFSLPERLQIFFFISAIVILLVLFFMVRPLKILKKLIIFFLIVWLMVVFSLAYTRYLAPVEGVLVRSTALYRDAGEQFASVSEQPVLSGNKLLVLEVLQNGTWLKVRTSQGVVGYVPHTAMRLI